MARGDLKRVILTALRRNPDRSSTAIAHETGSRPEYVRTVARRNGIRRRRQTGWPSLLDPDNRAWIEAQAQAAGASFSVMLNAVVTDARCEGEGNGDAA